MTEAEKAIAIHPDEVWQIAKAIAVRLSLGAPFGPSTAIRMLADEDYASGLVEAISQHRAKFAAREERLSKEFEALGRERRESLDAIVESIVVRMKAKA